MHFRIPHIRRICGTAVGIVALTVLQSTFAPAAAGQGTISGVITDAGTGESLIGVNVIVVGTVLGTASDFDGRYRIENVAGGEFSIRFSYIGYETLQFTGIVVRDGEVTTLDARLNEAVLSTEGEIVIIGEKPLVDVENSSSTQTISNEQLKVADLRGVKAAVATQIGVVMDPTGIFIRGGRADETGYIVDGVSAKDPLAGTGFGLEVGSGSIRDIELTTGGLGAEIGDATSGVVSVRTRDGTDTFAGSASVKMDNFGVNDDANSNFNESIYELSLGGPIVRGKLHFFVSTQVNLSDGFTRRVSTPDQVRTSLYKSTFWIPRTGNRWNGVSKLTYSFNPRKKLQISYQRSYTVNQNTRMLQVTGNDAVVAPGFQYAFVLSPDDANTYAHDNNISFVKWSHVLNQKSFYEIQASRLFTKLRADANGRNWRPTNVSSELDPESIVTFPANVFVNSDGQPLDPNALFVLPGPGLVNNGGIATRFHDHFAEEIVVRGSYTRFSDDKNSRLSVGLEIKFNDYQWIDIIRPWVGAPIGEGDDAESTDRLGSSSDIWRVKPRRGAIFGTQQIRYRGLIANFGARFEYWSPGKYVDDLVDDPSAPILDSIRENYKNSTINFFGLRTKFRLLPKIRVSFPIKENKVLFFNYGHSTKTPHPTFLYTGLDPFFQDRSFFSDLGNPNLDQEVDISYELGLRTQFSSDDALTVTAFWRDKFDFITVTNVLVPDPTGREVSRAFRINGDFARVKGIEFGYLKRFSDWLQGQIGGSFSRATGLSSTSNDALNQFLADGDIDNTFETPLAWDRPVDLKANVTLSHRVPGNFLGIPGLRNFSLFISSTYRSGLRYTPVEFKGREVNPFTGEQDWRPIYDTVSDPSKRLSETGKAWLWFDLNFIRTVNLVGADMDFSINITNLFDQKNGIIINPVTGEAYPDVDEENTDFTALRDNPEFDVNSGTRDPRFEDPNTTGRPPFNPARFLPQRHIMIGLSLRF